MHALVGVTNRKAFVSFGRVERCAWERRDTETEREAHHTPLQTPKAILTLILPSTLSNKIILYCSCGPIYGLCAVIIFFQQ